MQIRKLEFWKAVFVSHIDIKQQNQNLCLSLSPLYHPQSYNFSGPATILTSFLLQQQNNNKIALKLVI